MKFSPGRLFLFSLPLCFLAACSSSADDGSGSGPGRPVALPPSAVDCSMGSGTLTGRFLAPNGTTPIVGGFVYFGSGDCWAGTDKDGYFSATGLPVTETLVRAEKGLFRSEAKATPGASPLSLRVDASAVKLAYVPGSFDTIQRVLERLGFVPEPIDEEALSTADISQYAGIFLNCGLDTSHAREQEVQNVLKGYVENGGVLYASDWAEAYVRAVFPGRVNFLEPDARVGEAGPQEATVLDESLQRALGRNNATINFDASIWAVIDSVAQGTQVLVEGPVVTVDETQLSKRPYLVQFPAGQGRVTYTSFHNEAQTTGDMDILLEQLLFQL